MFHYTYIIINNNPIDNRKYYIGVRSSKNHPGIDNYHGSSKDLKSHIKLLGINSFTKKIFNIYSIRKDALQSEIHLHKKFNVSINVLFYNKVMQNSIKFDTTGTLYIKCKLTGIKKRINICDYNKDLHVYHSINKVSVKDYNGNTFQVNVNCEDYINKKYKHVSYN